MPKKSKSNLTVYAYGFDSYGFDVDSGSIQPQNDLRIEFVPFFSELSLDRSDGLIMPQGIFESIQYRRGAAGGTYTEVRVHDRLLLERERELTNLQREGKWVSFLVGEIIDTVPQGRNKDRIRSTDLCKKLLNNFGINRFTVDGQSSLTAMNEFQAYTHDYGVAKTVFKIPHDLSVESSTIVRGGDQCVGLELNNSLFFLPFHTTKKDGNTCCSIVSLVAKAVQDYRQKRIAEVPEWLNEFVFNEEENLQTQLESLRKQINNFEGQIQSWRNYKLIVTSSGDILRNTIITILETFFQFKVDPLDEKREDAKILDEHDNVLVMIEVKGTKKGIKRDHINQVDSHRERNNLEASVPGVLFINNEMSLQGIEAKVNTKVPDEHVKHAQNLNILIVRTIDFLFLMRQFEEDQDKKENLLSLFNSGGGWLKADATNYEIVTV